MVKKPFPLKSVHVYRSFIFRTGLCGINHHLSRKWRAMSKRFHWESKASLRGRNTRKLTAFWIGILTNRINRIKFLPFWSFWWTSFVQIQDLSKDEIKTGVGNVPTAGRKEKLKRPRFKVSQERHRMWRHMGKFISN